MSVHSSNKQLLARFLQELAAAEDSAIAGVLDRYCLIDCRWEIYHPFNAIDGNQEAAAKFWKPLKQAFPDYEQRVAFILAGEYEGRTQVSSWGHLFGNFEAAWLGIPPTWGTISLRFGFNAIVRGGKIAKAYVLLDIVDVMHQSGFYPLRPMPGSAGQWPFPPCDSGATCRDADPELGSRTLAIVREMQIGLPKSGQVTDAASARARHSPHWHENMNWYGPAGIGSSRGLRGFRDYHGALFLKAFPDRSGVPREAGCPEDAPGHYVQMGDGRFSVTGGHPSLFATHTGGQWLGLPPTGRRISMRVADWYRLDEDDKIIDNWVMMDVPHILDQMGLDIFEDLQFFVDKSRSRLPE
jgi:predicted ester cyclase